MVKYILVRPLTLIMLENDVCLGYSLTVNPPLKTIISRCSSTEGYCCAGGYFLS